jgi:hypothetical protein
VRARNEAEMTSVNESKGRIEMKASHTRQGRSPRACWTAAALAMLVLFGLAAASSQAASKDYFSFDEIGASLSNPQAARHADFEPRFVFEGSPTQPIYGGYAPWASMRDFVLALPPGLLGNPAAFPTCSASQFIGQVSSGEPPCDPNSQVGMLSPGLGGILQFPPGEYYEPVYNLEAPGGNSHVVARLGFVAFVYPMYIDIRVDPTRDNALTATVVNPPALVPLTGAYTRLWGAPTDPSHDLERYSWRELIFCGHLCEEEVENPTTHEIEFKIVPRPSGLPPTPFMSNPTSCGPTQVEMAADSYQRYGDYDFSITPLAEVTDCESVPFEPTMSLQPTTRSPSSSSGLDVNLEIPQDGLEDPEGAVSSHLEEAAVTLAQGVTLNASSADGLGSCSEDEIGLHRNERQLVGIGGHGAPVSLSLGGHSTATLPQYASAAEVQAALEGLPNVGAGNIAVSGRVGGPWNVEFEGALANQDVPSIAGNNSELQQLALSAEGGSYKLGFEGEETAPIPFGADPAEVQAALEALPGVALGDLEVNGDANGTFYVGRPVFRIAFTGALAGNDVPEITIDPELGNLQLAEVEELVKGGSALSVETEQQGGTISFDASEPRCPESSKVATGEIETPVLKNKLDANFYLAKQSDNPFNSLFAGYLVASGQGVTIKVPAKIDVDPATGQVTTTFTQNPQQPFEDLELHFKGGNRGLLTTPDKCGTYASTYELTPWSGNPPVKGQSEFTLDENCGAKPFAPGFHAGSETALAGSFTTFATQVTNEPGAPDLTRISVDLPEGLSAKLAGVATCPDAALSSLPTGPGTGAAQIAGPSCPASSQIGTVQAGAGSGSPFYVKTGKAYLAGPYKGAPLSLAVLTPAVAGPFDLGNVLVRVPISLDRKTARAHAVSDPIPTSLQGIPLDLRDVRVLLDRQGFALNPTSCEPKSADGVIEGTGGASANVSDRFQVGECAALGFKPKLSLKLKGGTKRGDHPALSAVFRPRPGDANASYVQVALPKSEFLDQGHIGTVCTRVQFDANACPKASIYGSVTAQTPLLDQPLTGNVYLRSSSNELPDLVMDLRGPASQPIHLEADGRIDSIKGGIRTTFEFVPDAPITRVVLKMKGAKKGLLQNSRDICAQTFKANASFAAHNGRTLTAQPEMQARCKGSARKGKGHGKKHHG